MGLKATCVEDMVRKNLSEVLQTIIGMPSEENAHISELFQEVGMKK